MNEGYIDWKGRALAAEAETLNLKNLCAHHGICTACGEYYSHHYIEPFATCNCNTSEWYELTEYMKLQDELRKLREQEPVAYVKYKATGGNVGLAWMAIPTQVYYPREGEPLYAGPVPAAPRKYHEFASVMLDAQPFITAETYGGRYIVAMRFERLGKMQDCHAALLALLQSAPQAPAVPELDPMTRLIVSDPKQLKPKKQEPAVPSVVFMAHNKTSSILFAARKDADQYAAAAGPTAGVSVTECAVIESQSAEGCSSQAQNMVTK